MKKLLLYISLLLFVACKNPDQELRGKLMPILHSAIIQDSMLSKVDSLRIIKIDTLTDLILAKRRMINLTMKADSYTEVARYCLDQAKLSQQSGELSLEQERLYAELNSPTLVDIQKNEVIRHSKDIKELINKAQLYNDSAGIYIKKQEAIQHQIDQHAIDPKNFKGYSVLFSVSDADKRNIEIKKDSLKLYVSPAFRIIPAKTI